MVNKKTYVRNTSKASNVIGTSEPPEGRIVPTTSTRKKKVAEREADVVGLQLQTAGGMLEKVERDETPIAREATGEEINGETSTSGESDGENNGEQSTEVEVEDEVLREEENVDKIVKPRKKGVGGGRGRADIQRGIPVPKTI